MREALQLALDALLQFPVTDCLIPDKTEKAIASIAEALRYEAKQVSPHQFLEIVKDKADCIGIPIIWAEWPSKELK